MIIYRILSQRSGIDIIGIVGHVGIQLVIQCLDIVEFGRSLHIINCKTGAGCIEDFIRTGLSIAIQIDQDRVHLAITVHIREDGIHSVHFTVADIDRRTVAGLDLLHTDNVDVQFTGLIIDIRRLNLRPTIILALDLAIVVTVIAPIVLDLGDHRLVLGGGVRMCVNLG